MTATLTSITLSEWETQGPDNCADLAGRFLDASPGTRRVVERLTESKLLGLTELRHGLEIKAFSHVGRIRVGDLEYHDSAQDQRNIAAQSCSLRLRVPPPEPDF